MSPLPQTGLAVDDQRRHRPQPCQAGLGAVMSASDASGINCVERVRFAAVPLAANPLAIPGDPASRVNDRLAAASSTSLTG